MTKTISPSDYTDNTVVNYDAAQGYYCSGKDIVALLQIPSDSGTFSSNTSPTAVDVGKIIKRVEDYVDERIGYSYRPNVYSDEYHNFELRPLTHAQRFNYVDYVGFIQLERTKIRKIISLEVWQGTEYKQLASNHASVTFNSDADNVSNIRLTLPDGGYFDLAGAADFGSDLTANEFNNKLGPATTALDFAALVNEQYPTKTQQFTKQQLKKAKTANDGVRSVSDYFYAYIDTENSSKVIITSLLPGNDGDSCTITATQSPTDGCTLVDFAPSGAEKNRTEDWWMIGDEGKLFFTREFPYLNNNSVRVNYITGSGRVPGYINEVATKLAASELLRHDDSTVLIGQTEGGIDAKTKYDELRKDANAILDSKRRMAYFMNL